MASGPQVSNCTHLSDFVVCVNGSAAIAKSRAVFTSLTVVEVNGLINRGNKYVQTRQNLVSFPTGPLIVYAGNPALKVNQDNFLIEIQSPVTVLCFPNLQSIVDVVTRHRVFFRSWDTVLSAGLVATVLMLASNPASVHLCGFSMNTSRHGYPDPHNKLHSEKFREHGRPDAAALSLMSLAHNNVSSCSDSLQHLLHSFAPGSPKRAPFQSGDGKANVGRDRRHFFGILSEASRRLRS